MKKHLSPLSPFFLILLTYPAWAGTTSLTTYYPPPTAAYTKIKLSTSASYVSSTYCGTPAAPANSGAVFVDSTGTLNVCMNGSATVYPQECYNSYCSYDSTKYAPPPDQSQTGNPCVWSAPGTYAPTFNTPCKSGFAPTAADPAGDLYDVFQTSSSTSVVSYICCSGTQPAGTLTDNLIDNNGDNTPGGTATPGEEGSGGSGGPGACGAGIVTQGGCAVNFIVSQIFDNSTLTQACYGIHGNTCVGTATMTCDSNGNGVVNFSNCQLTVAAPTSTATSTSTSTSVAGGIGSPCTQPSDCLSGYCDENPGGLCTNGGLGALCGQSRDCSSGDCSHGTCHFVVVI